MNQIIIKEFIEKNIKVSEDKFENQVELKLQKGNIEDTITLIGNGSLKILEPIV